jgi:hypothetical protein
VYSEEMDNQETIDEVAVIGPIKDENATHELLNSKVLELFESHSCSRKKFHIHTVCHQCQHASRKNDEDVEFIDIEFE